MLIRDYTIGYYLRHYSHFRSALEWLRMYCSGEMGVGSQDYIEGYRHLRRAFVDVSQLFRDYSSYLDDYLSRFPDLRLSLTLMGELDALVKQINGNRHTLTIDFMSAPILLRTRRAGYAGR